MKLLFVFMLTLGSQLTQAQSNRVLTIPQDKWAYMEANPDGTHLKIATVRVKTDSSQMTLMIRNTNGQMDASLIFAEKVVPVDHIAVTYGDHSTDSIAVSVNPKKQEYSMDITPPLSKFLRKMNHADNISLTIVFKDQGPVRFVVPTDRNTLKFLNQ